MTVITTNVHPDNDAVLAFKVTDYTGSAPFRPYYTVGLEGVAIFVSPTQLTQLADGLAQYQTPLRPNIAWASCTVPVTPSREFIPQYVPEADFLDSLDFDLAAIDPYIDSDHDSDIAVYIPRDFTGTVTTKVAA